MSKLKLFIVGGGGLGMQVAQDLEKHKIGKDLFDVYVFDKKKEVSCYYNYSIKKQMVLCVVVVFEYNAE
jgi:uncharacterized membrane protein YsdA (DUF1294 family)